MHFIKTLIVVLICSLSISLNAQNSEMMNLKWMNYMRASYTVSPEFIQQLDHQLKPQIVDKLGVELNWNKVLFLVAPEMEDSFNTESDSGEKRSYFFRPAIAFRYYRLPAKVYWRSKKENRYINTSECVTLDDIEFVLEEIDSQMLDEFPLANVEIPLKPIDMETSFPVSVDGFISHEGNLLFTLQDHLQLNEVESVLGDYMNFWNTSSESIYGLGLEERGKFHQIYINKSEGEEGKIYYDYGSANEAALKFAKQGLDQEVTGIISLIIEGLF